MQVMIGLTSKHEDPCHHEVAPESAGARAARSSRVWVVRDFRFGHQAEGGGELPRT